MRRWRQWLGCVSVCLSLIGASSAAVASAAPAPAPAGDAWLTLSMLTPSGAVGLGDAAVAGAQPGTPAPSGYTGSSSPPLPVVLVWLSVLGTDIYLLLRHDHNHHREPNSPA